MALCHYLMMDYCGKPINRNSTKSLKKDDIDLNHNECVYIIDGGWLLHRLQWNKGDISHKMFTSYVTYLQRNFKSDIAVVFDGYSNSSNSIKGIERLCWSNKNMFPDIHFDQHMSVTAVSYTHLDVYKRQRSRWICCDG